VEIWKGKTPHEKNRCRLSFVVKVTDWGRMGNCQNREDYRVKVPISAYARSIG